jgi:hypothetical protein
MHGHSIKPKIVPQIQYGIKQKIHTQSSTRPHTKDKNISGSQMHIVIIIPSPQARIPESHAKNRGHAPAKQTKKQISIQYNIKI